MLSAERFERNTGDAPSAGHMVGMGSTNFENVYYGDSDMTDAYRELCERETQEYGRDPYNGTIATTSGVRLLVGSPMSELAAFRLAEAHLDEFTKGEACGAIPLVDRAEVKPCTRTVKVTVPGPVDYESLRTAVEVTLAEGEVAGDIHWNWNTGYTAVGSDLPLPVAKTKIVAAATDGAALTTYTVLCDGRVLEQGFATQAAARAQALAIAKAETSAQTHTYGVRAVTSREHGDADLVRVVRTVVSTKITCRVAVALPVPASAARKGWLFFGWAAM